MSQDNSVTFSDLEHHLPPESPRGYISHDLYLRDQLGDGAIQSIKKEIEGMVRLYESTEGKLDQAAREALLKQLIAEIDELDYFEDEVAAVEHKVYQE